MPPPKKRALVWSMSHAPAQVEHESSPCAKPRPNIAAIGESCHRATVEPVAAVLPHQSAEGAPSPGQGRYSRTDLINMLRVFLRMGGIEQHDIELELMTDTGLASMLRGVQTRELKLI